MSYPQAEISNGLVRAAIALPGATDGFYRGTRFDWSGVITSLACQGHSYFGQWYDRHDPVVHDAITGPVEEFHSGSGGLGYAEAPVGGNFIRIGVGALRKSAEPAFQRFHTYEIADPGRWSIERQPDGVMFEHDLGTHAGYAYVYRKTMTLPAGLPRLRIQHTLTNTGQRKIAASQYNHNFLTLDGSPTGPDFQVRFPFSVQTSADLKGIVEVQPGRITYLRELRKGESILADLQGFDETPEHYDITVENARTGAGVRIRGDRPLSQLIFWSIRATLCPEPHIALEIDPGEDSSWSVSYDFLAR